MFSCYVFRDQRQKVSRPLFW